MIISLVFKSIEILYKCYTIGNLEAASVTMHSYIHQKCQKLMFSLPTTYKLENVKKSSNFSSNIHIHFITSFVGGILIDHLYKTIKTNSKLRFHVKSFSYRIYCVLEIFVVSLKLVTILVLEHWRKLELLFDFLISLDNSWAFRC